MAIPYLRTFRRALRRCGFAASLIRSDYRFADFRSAGMPLRTVDLAAFATRPIDLHSACVGVVHPSPDHATHLETLDECWALGARYVFVVEGQTIEWWVMKGRGAPEKRQRVPLSGLESFFEQNAPVFAPARVLREKSSLGRQLDFVDAGLLPALNHEVGEKLHGLLERLVRDATGAYKNTHGCEPAFPKLFRLVFRLLAGKILKDKGELSDLDFASPTHVLAEVARYYGEQEFSYPVLTDAAVVKLVSERVSEAIRFHNLSSESLAHVYENTLVTKETRKRYGTHSTPRYIADYITWRLPIDEIPIEQRHVFDPGVGCASFLVSAMRRLRLDLPPTWTTAKEHEYFARHLHGFDVDDFALETAVLHLTLADFPNRDGWDLPNADLWTTRVLEEGARQARIFLANPPFQNFTPQERADLPKQGMAPEAANKASELVRRVLPHLPDGALIGVVLPRETLEGTKSLRVREESLRQLQLLEISFLPDRMFTHSNAESGILLARKSPQRTQVSFRQVDEDGRAQFREFYSATRKETVPQARFESNPRKTLFVPALARLWEHLQSACCKLEAIAQVGKGLDYKPKQSLSGDAQTVSEDYFFGAVRGCSRASDSLSAFLLSSLAWMSVEKETIARARMGADTGNPQVLMNYACSSRRIWRANAAVDGNGLAFSARFCVVRPTDGDFSLRLLAALLNGPVTNAYLSSFCGKRDNSYPVVRSIPVPPTSPGQAAGIEEAVRVFEEAIRPEEPFEPHRSDNELRLLLAKVDALVLELYNLPRDLRKELMEPFKGKKRPGLSFDYELSEDLLKQALKRRIPHEEPQNPWVELAGMWADDPTWDDFMAEVAHVRASTGD